MADRKPPVITTDTPIGPDVDLDREDVRLPGGARLTSARAAAIVKEVRHATGRPRRLVVGFRYRSRPLHELLRDRHVRTTVAGALRRMADTIEHGRAH